MTSNNKRFNSSYLFILPYALIFMIFIVLLLLISFLLSFTYYDGVNDGVELLNDCVQIKLSKEEAELIIRALECFENRVECALLIKKIEKYQKEIKDEKWNHYAKGKRRFKGS